MPRTWPLPQAEIRSLRRGEREGESLINQVFTGYKAISVCHWFKISQTISRYFVYPVYLGLSKTHLAHPCAMGTTPRESPSLGRQR